VNSNLNNSQNTDKSTNYQDIEKSTFDIKYYHSIIEHAHKEIDSVKNVYKWLAGNLGLIIATGIGVGSYITYNTVQDIKTDMEKELSNNSIIFRNKMKILEDSVDILSHIKENHLILLNTQHIQH